MTRAKRKQIDNNKVSPMLVTGLVTSGTSDIVTSVLVTAAASDGVTVIPSTGSGSSLGFLVTTPFNKIKLVGNTSKSLIGDINSNEIFGRLTESGGVYTLSYFSMQSGSEVAVSLSATIDFFPQYNYEFKDFPFDSSLRILDNIVNVVAQAPSVLEISSNTTINSFSAYNEIDISGGDIIITLGDISLGAITKNLEMIFKIVANNGNTATFQGTANNFEDEDIQIGSDPELGLLRLIARNDNTWGTTGIL